MVLDCKPYSSSVSEVPGAHSEDAMGEKVDMAPTQNMSVHFLPQAQFLHGSAYIAQSEGWSTCCGFAGSSILSQPTKPLSRSINTTARSPLACGLATTSSCLTLSSDGNVVVISFSISLFRGIRVSKLQSMGVLAIITASDHGPVSTFVLLSNVEIDRQHFDYQTMCYSRGMAKHLGWRE